jgi:hypothetical protein
MRSGINEDKVILAKAAQAAGQTAINSDVIDTAGAESVEFLVVWGAITAGGVQSVKLQQGKLSDLSDSADLAGSSQAVADTDDNKITRAEIIRPQERYVRAVVSRETQDSVVSAIIAILRFPRVRPITQHSTIQGTPEVHVSPDEGTA